MRVNITREQHVYVERCRSDWSLDKPSAVQNLKVRIYKTVILPVLLYGCETWTLTLREEHRFRVFENKVLRKIFGAKRDEVTGEWRKLHNTELHALYSSPDIIRNIKSRRLRWAGHVARMGESRNAYRVLVGRPEGKRPLGRPRRRWEDNIKMDLREVGYDDRDWINLAQDRDRWRAYVRAAMNLRYSLRRISIPCQGCQLRYDYLVVLGSCQHGELLRNSRHHNIRKLIAQALRKRPFEVHEEVHCVASEGGGIRRADIVALDKNNSKGFILDPTVRFELSQTQPSEDNKEKQQIYEPTIPYFREKYQMEGTWEVHGLMIGARGTIPRSTVNTFGIHDMIPKIITSSIKGKILWAKRDEVTEEWRKLHNTELHALYSSPDIIRNIKSRRLRWAGHVARMGESRNAFRVLVGRPERKYLWGSRDVGERAPCCEVTAFGLNGAHQDGLAFRDCNAPARLLAAWKHSEGGGVHSTVIEGLLIFVSLNSQKRAKTAQSLAFTERRIEAGGENRNANRLIYWPICRRAGRRSNSADFKYKKVDSNKASSCTPYCDDSVDDEEMGGDLFQC
ncbi:hypothetical protein ANN_01945 [Periplaneta americana]|uniref:Uncharacterized protein n=1 Tax=Periplaneta americana TaxID=6978 RepID=A0ABQ8TW27_PERAM|nr:hypothetical protein ANN_01945 [Periplaneta americana]